MTLDSRPPSFDKPRANTYHPYDEYDVCRQVRDGRTKKARF